MSKQRLPDDAYAALNGLKEQAGAALLMLPGRNKVEGKNALANAHAQIAANEVWAKKIVKALMSSGGQTTIDSADVEWLERTFAEPAV